MPAGSKKSKKGTKNGEVSDKINDSEISYDEEFDERANFEMLQKHFDEKVASLKLEYDAKLEVLHKIIDKKDDMIAKLNKDIGEMKQGLNFMTNETADLKKAISETAEHMKSRVGETDKKIADIKTKTVDLEDRSRRCNLVFFNFPEVSRLVSEDCEDTIEKKLISLKILPDGEQIWIDRAHRLGKRRPEHDTRPRPIIAKFSYYKQKEHILRNGYKFKDSPINVSEDYSKETLHVHRELRKHGINAKESCRTDSTVNIKQFKVTYRRLIVTYVNKANPAVPFTRSFNLQYIEGNTKWYVPPAKMSPQPDSAL